MHIYIYIYICITCIIIRICDCWSIRKLRSGVTPTALYAEDIPQKSATLFFNTGEVKWIVSYSWRIIRYIFTFVLVKIYLIYIYIYFFRSDIFLRGQSELFMNSKVNSELFIKYHELFINYHQICFYVCPRKNISDLFFFISDIFLRGQSELFMTYHQTYFYEEKPWRLSLILGEEIMTFESVRYRADFGEMSANRFSSPTTLCIGEISQKSAQCPISYIQWP